MSKWAPKRLGVLLLLLGIGLPCFALPRHLKAGRLLLALQRDPSPSLPGERSRRLSIEGSQGKPLFAQSYGPARGEEGKTLIVAHGIHHRGTNEPRLVQFASQLAELGYRVVTPEMETLTDYSIDRSAADTLTAWVHKEGSSKRPVGLIGFSFAGSMALLAAQDSDTADRLRYVASIGGYHDLRRSLRFLVTNMAQGPEGTVHKQAHEYGTLLLLLDQLSAFDLGIDSSPLRHALVFWLREEREKALAIASTLETKRGKEVFQAIKNRRHEVLRDKLLSQLNRQRRRLNELSPRGRLEDVSCPIILIHGSSDSVIPAEETRFAVRELRNSEKNDYTHLITPLVSHAEMDQPHLLLDALQLIHVVSKLL